MVITVSICIFNSIIQKEILEKRQKIPLVLKSDLKIVFLRILICGKITKLFIFEQKQKNGQHIYLYNKCHFLK